MRRSLHLHIDPSSYTTPKVDVSTRISSPAFSANMSMRNEVDNYNSDAGASDTPLFSVLCKYDFSSDEDGLLPFRKGEILEVVKRDNTGWWAAMRKEGPIVGWIPQAFVVQLSPDMVDKLRNTRKECRIYEYDAEQLYNSAPVSRTRALFDIDSAISSPLPEYEAYRANTPSTALHDAKRDQNVNPYSKSNPSWPGGRPVPPPSPTSPMPRPPGPLPEKKSKANLVHSGATESIQNQATTLTSKRSTRARGVTLEDNSTLRRMNSLIESKNSREIERPSTPDTINFSETPKPTRTARLKRQASSFARQRETIIHIRPWYLQPQLADQIEEDAKGHIRNASFAALIERLTTHDAPVTSTGQSEFDTFTKVFLSTFRTFTTANNFFETLAQRYNARPPQSLSEQEYADWKESWQAPTRRRILEIFNSWLEDHRLLEEEPYLAKSLTTFLRTITRPPHNMHAEAIIQTLERLTFTVPSDTSLQTTPRKPRKSKAHKGDLLKLDPVDLAEQLALWEQGLYVKVTLQECLSYAKTQSGPSVAKLLAFCNTHDNLVSWVKGSVLGHEILGKRSDTVDFWIKVAEKCRLLNNIASMSAIIIALSSTDISRLHLTWAHVNRKSVLDTLLRHNEPTGGFAGYRAILKSAEGPCVPFVTMYLADILHAQENFAYQDADGLICFYKRARWYEIINNMLKFQTRIYNIAPNETTRQFIESQLSVASTRDQNWFWSKSQEVQHSELAHADIRKGLERAGF